MKRPVMSAPVRWKSRRVGRGYTLVEVLMATALTGLLMVAVVEIFAAIGNSVSNSRSILELSDRLRTTATRLKMDLDGVTVTMLPPRRPEGDEGYLELDEGQYTAADVYGSNPPLAIDIDANRTDPRDTTVGDVDDVLMFTTRSSGRPFIGRIGATAAESEVAEVIWFVRGNTLYRRVLLVLPRVDPTTDTNGDSVPRAGFYRNYDLSVHFDGTRLVANTLGDLTKRECRFAHDPAPDPNHFPGSPHATAEWTALGLPTLRECSHSNWVAGDALPQITLTPNPPVSIDLWENPHPWSEVDTQTGTLRDYIGGPRIGEDVILTNVIGFDVQVWDPGAPVLGAGDVALGPGDIGYASAVAANWDIVSYGAYVDLGYNPSGSTPQVGANAQFYHDGDPRSKLNRVYDTWSFHYEHDGISQDGDVATDEGTDGFDNDALNDSGYGVVDDPGEMETSPPYPVPLRGIRVKIRVFEPDSRQIREVTVVQDFLPK